MVSRFLRTKHDEKVIAAWRLNLIGILQALNVCPLHSRVTVTDFPLPDRACNNHTSNRF